MDDKAVTQLKADYQKGISPLGLSLKYNIEIDKVYEILEQKEMNHVVYGGDMIDAEPNVQLNGPTVNKIPYTKI